jgi:hypothetical protein
MIIRCALSLLLCLALVPAAGAGHRFLAVDDGTLTLQHIDQADPARTWKVPFGGYCMDMQLIGDQRILLAVDDGYRELALADGRELKAFKGVLRGRVHSIERLADGRTLLAIRGHPGLNHGLIVLDRQDQVEAKLAWPGVESIRHLRGTARGTLIIAAAGAVLESKLDGTVVWRAKVPGNNFKAVELDGQRVMVSCGPGGRTLRTIDHTGKVLATLDGGNLKEGAFTGFHRLANGHWVVANWLGHGSKHDGLSLFEYDATGAVVWNFGQPKSSFVEVIVLDGLDTGLLHAQHQDGRLAPPAPEP